MFGWRKKPEGFEWHQYIRTTIKVRRENRRRRIEDAKHAAAQQVSAAGAALAAGSKAAGAAARDGARAGSASPEWPRRARAIRCSRQARCCCGSSVRRCSC